MSTIEGVILAGGQSRRMGRDKAAIVLGGVPVLERIATAMSPLVERIRVIGDRVTDARGLEVQPDLEPGLGPLSGIHAALATATAGAVLVVGCDLPFVTASFLSGLCERLDDGADAVVPRVSGRAVPVCAVYRTDCLDRLESSLARRELKAASFVTSLATRYVDDEELARLDPHAVCLVNVNTPEDLERAQALAARESE
jgi:molybdenum cofactor guanylyltransferase